MMPTLRRILCVDDEPDIQTVTRVALETTGGFTVRTCDSGAEALEVASTFLPDLILLDIMMPGMDGLEVLTALRRIPETAATPVVFLTAKVQPKEVERYKASGAAEVIRKPFDPMGLSGELARIWGRCHA